MKQLKKVICLLFAAAMLFTACTGPSNIEPTTEPTTAAITEVIFADEAKELAKDTKEDIMSGETIESEDTVKSSPLEEKTIEEDGSVESGELSWDGDATAAEKKEAKALLGKYQGLTYYSQLDKRWANIPYTSIGDKSQTIKTSGCGPTSAAMIISSSKGAIIPPTTAKLFVDNGFRTPNNGTAWSAWAFTADVFDFKEYHAVSRFSKVVDYLKTDKDKNGISDYFVVASCGPGLFTSGGHYICLMGISKDVVMVYDPYYYLGKYNTVSRKPAKVVMKGNAAYVTTAALKKYANFKSFWVFSNDHTKVIKPTTTKKKVTTTKKKETTTKKKETTTKPTTPTKKVIRYVKVSTSLNVRTGPGTNYKIVDSLKNGTKVTVYKTKNGWSRIGNKRWVASNYLVATNKDKNIATYRTTVGKTYKIKATTNLYSKGTLKGTVYTYKANTTVKVLKHYNKNVDFVRVIATGREAYVRVGALKGV